MNTMLEAPPRGPSTKLPAPPSTADGWSIVWRGSTYREADLTGQHLATLSLLVGSDDWTTLDMDPRHGYQRLMYMIAAFRAVEVANAAGTGDDVVAEQMAVVISEVSKASADEILGALRY